MKVIIFADAWGAKYGGINTFNYDFCKALGSLNKIKVYVICVAANNADIAEAKKYNVTLKSVTQDDFRKCEFDLQNIANDKDSIFWVGHDVKTGKQAISAKETYKAGKIVLFNHMNYQETAPMKDTGNAQIKIADQRNTFSKADIIFCVGPKLYNGMCDIKSSYNYTADVRQIIPGFIESHVNENSNKSFNVLISGRIEGDNDRIKQIKTAILAVHRVCENRNDVINVKLIGANNVADAKKIQDDINIMLDKYDKDVKYLNTIVQPYTEDRESLFQFIRESSVSLMLSLSEGFGLVGLEAIALGVPLVLNKNSGLYEFLKNKGLSFFVHSLNIKSANNTDINNDDVENVSKVLDKILNDQKSAKQLALCLRKKLENELTWRNTAKTFLQGIGNFKFMVDSSTIFPNEQFAITHEGDIFYANKGFETAIFYKQILLYAEKRLWIFGRKNRKLFSNDNNDFFSDLKYKKEHGFDFRCLFQSIASADKILNNAQDVKNFKLQLKASIQCAANKFEQNNLSISDFCKTYTCQRDEVIIIVDDKIIIHKVIRNKNNMPAHLTDSDFYILDANCPIFNKYINKFESLWKKSTTISDQDVEMLDS